ncbi:MAG: O-antigen ligase family protein [Bacteroidota bacterium]
MQIGYKKLRYSELTLLLYTFLIPLEEFFLQNLVGSTTRIAGGAMILIYLLIEPPINWRKFSLSFYLYFIWAASSIIIWANSPSYFAIFRLSMWMIITIIAALIIARNTALIPLLLKVYALSSFFLVYVAIKNFGQIEDIEFDRVDVKGVNQNLIATHFLISIIFIIFSYFRYDYSARNKTLLIWLIIIFTLGIIASGSRSALFVLLLSFFFILPKDTIRFSTIARTLLILCLAGYFLMYTDNGFTRYLNRRIELAQTDKAANRLIIWKVAENMIEENIIIGVGYRNFPSEFSAYLDKTKLEEEERYRIGDRRYAGTHNAFLETWSELGLIGLLLFYGFQFRLTRKLYQNKSNESQLALILLLGININALFGDLANWKFFWLIVSVCMAILIHATKDKKLKKLSLFKNT